MQIALLTQPRCTAGKLCLNCDKAIVGAHYLIQKRPWCEGWARPYLGRSERMGGLLKAGLLLVATAGILIGAALLSKMVGRIYYGAACFAFVWVAFKLFYPREGARVDVERIDG